MSGGVNMTNAELINHMLEKGEIAYGLKEGNIPVTMNDLIEICNEEGISLDAPILLECPTGYFPLAYCHNAVANDENGKEYTINCLALTDGEW